ncbi:PAS domain S-box protein [Legionella londiniensis]|uniref:Regulatory protein (GGDEF, EAL, PAS and PAC domains) n=1 Tax=Legionella londiniensis TaxID=45068 RepID=A0A0W0VQR9_9GAMM|nr:PAS domain S-box protein [Legionella londiniensis]KTD22419.1 regulatory protein (GGDEF, EAL, PAS and PAC domains) [Legionella londiniensis]STX93008.1 regulatory protein (GGDEF, EAL, PAS and PAC domains) [Legionella londiniensis]
MAGLEADVTVTICEEGKIIEIEGNFKKLFGWEIKEVLGKSVEILMPYKYRERHRAGFERWRRTGEKRAIGTWMAIEAKHKDGHVFPISMILAERIIGKHRRVTAYFITNRHMISNST